MEEEVSVRSKMNTQSKETVPEKKDQMKKRIPTIGELLDMWRRRQELEPTDKKPDLQNQQSVTVSFIGSTTTDRNRKSFLPSLQRDVYDLLHRPHSWFAYCYHLFVFLIVFMCLFVTVFTTIRKFENDFFQVMLEMEKVIIVWFTGEFIIRLWASSCWSRYRGLRGKLRYLCSPAHFIDLIVIIVSITVLLVQSSRESNLVFAGSAFRGFHRFFQVVRMIRTERRFTPFRVLLSVLYAQREQLIVITYIAFLVLSFAAFVLYLAEKDTNEQFESIADAFWWAVVSLFTIGYGDKVPTTWLGKLMASFFIMIGVSIFTIPAGILGAGLAINIQQQQKIQQNKKKQIPAARLIQTAWRFYATNPNSCSVTWNRYQVYWNIGLAERNAIRFLLLMKFLRAVKHFKAISTVKDIHYMIEQNRTDHLTINFKINEMKTNLIDLQSKYNSNANRISDQISQLEKLSKELGEQCKRIGNTKLP